MGYPVLMTLAHLHRPLGNTGLQVSPLGLGTVKIGRNQGVKYPSGINLPDTAPAYGTSEERLGPLLQGQRQDWVLCTKVGEEFVDGQSRFDFSAAHTRFSVQRSLQRLHTDYLDLVLVHSSGDDLTV